MKYVNTFITVAPDCPVTESAIPPKRGSKLTVQVLEISLMPANHAEQLTVKQLHDLFAFLMTLE